MLSKKELFVLTITLKQFGLTPAEIKTIIDHFKYKGTKYELIIKAVSKLQKHYANTDFDKGEFCRLIKIEDLYRRNIDAIIKREQVFRDNGYSDKEIDYIENVFSNVVGHRVGTLDAKLKFYNDINIKHLIVEQPYHLKQGIKLSYARHQFLIIKSTYEQEKSNLFVSETYFKSLYGVYDKVLLKKYPVDARYLVKK